MAQPRLRTNRLPVPPRPLTSRVHGPSRTLESSLERVRRLAREHQVDDKPFDPTQRGTWRGSSRDLVVNGRVEDECIVITLDGERYGTAIANPLDVPRGRHARETSLFAFSFGAYGDTKVAVWEARDHIDSALEQAAEWLSKYAPGIFTEVESESDEADMTYTESGYIASWEWNVDELTSGPLYDAALAESEKAFQKEYGDKYADQLEPNHRRNVSSETLNPFQRAFLEAALWSSHDNADDSGGEPLDENYDISDFDPGSLARLLRDCDAFEADNAALLEQAGTREQNGHDFWLTRCGHGAGFWDRGYSRSVGDALTKVSKAYGNVDLTVEGDGHIYTT